MLLLEWANLILEICRLGGDGLLIGRDCAIFILMTAAHGRRQGQVLETRGGPGVANQRGQGSIEALDSRGKACGQQRMA